MSHIPLEAAKVFDFRYASPHVKEFWAQFVFDIIIFVFFLPGVP
jgi:hypothetical protein